MKRPELRLPVLHQQLFVYTLEKLNYPPKKLNKRRNYKDSCQISTGEQSDQHSKYKQFEEHKESGIDAAVTDVPYRNSAVFKLKIETHKI